MTLTVEDLQAFWLTIKLALIVVLILILLGTPLAWWLAHTSNRLKWLISSIVSLPLVLPPSVLGFYFLIAVSSKGPIGALTSFLGLPNLAFTFEGLIVASVIYSLPFVVQPIQNSFEHLRNETIEVAYLMRMTKFEIFLKVILPLSKNGFITASVLGFAHTLGEFGVVLMIGGNIPGETKVISVQIYEQVEALQYGRAHTLSLLLVLLSFICLTIITAANKRWSIRI